MANLIATIILVGSILGIIFILFRKLPILVELPEVEEVSQVEVSIQEIKGKIKSIFPPYTILQKILSRVRIIVLRVERKIDNLLQRLRKKAQEKREENKDSLE